MDESTNRDASGIIPSNNFLGLLPLPYSMSTLKGSLPTLDDMSASSQTSGSFSDLNSMSSSTYRRGLSSFSKPSPFNQVREQERFELSTLNDKFADYVEKVRYLEAQNKKIQMDASFLQEKEHENSQKIKTLFESEIAQFKELAEQLFKDKNIVFNNSRDTQKSNVASKEQLDQTFNQRDSSNYETEQVEQQLSSVEGDILMYKRRLAHQDNEQAQWKQFTTHLQRLILQAKNEINNEVMTHASCEQRTKQLHIDIIRLREQQLNKINDLKQSSFILSLNSTNERAHMFKSELSNAIRRIRQDVDRQNDSHRNDLYKQFTQSYETIFRQDPELAHLFLSDREHDRIRQEEERLRSDIQRVRTDTQLLKQKNADLKLHIRELQINLEMATEENERIEQIQQNEIDQMKSKHEKITKNYDDVVTKQTSLEKEIQTYSNLLETTMKPVVDNITQEFNSRTANQMKFEQQHRKMRSPSVDRVLSTSFQTNDTNNLYASSMTLNLNNSLDLSKGTNGNDLKPDITNTDQHSLETSSKVRSPIIVQTRRNN